MSRSLILLLRQMQQNGMALKCIIVNIFQHPFHPSHIIYKVIRPMETKRFQTICLISIVWFWGACSKPSAQATSSHMFQYQICDIAYDNTLYVGVCFINEKDIHQAQYIVSEVNEIKEYYKKYGIETLLNEYNEWYLHPSNSLGTFRLGGKSIPWNTTTERYLIYLALRNNYVVYIDDESGYLCFEK